MTFPVWPFLLLLPLLGSLYNTCRVVEVWPVRRTDKAQALYAIAGRVFAVAYGLCAIWVVARLGLEIFIGDADVLIPSFMLLMAIVLIIEQLRANRRRLAFAPR